MSQRRKWFLGGGVLLLLGLLGMARSFVNGEGTPVQTMRVERTDLIAEVTASGEIKPRNYINIGAESMGRLVAIHVVEGEQVRKGEVLARIENTQPATEVAAQKAQLDFTAADLAAAKAGVESNEAQRNTRVASLRRAKAELDRARINFERAAQLLEDGLVARQEYDQRRADHEAAKAAVSEAEAALDEAEARQKQLAAQQRSAENRVAQAQAQLARADYILSKYLAVSPIDGIVTNLPVREGETVVPGIQNSSASLIMTIADMSLITAEIKVDETDIVNVRLGQLAEVFIDAEPGQAIAVRQASDVGLGTTPGDSSRSPRDLEGVFVVKEDKAMFRPLRIGITGASEIEVTEGLQEGDEIISGPYSTLRTLAPGTKVRAEAAPK